MDLLQRAADATQQIVVFVGGVVAWVAGRFEVTLDTTTAELIAMLILAGFAFRMIFWRIGNAKSFQPQTIILPTAKTPWQVLMGDVQGCLKTLLWLVLIFVGLYLLANALSGS